MWELTINPLIILWSPGGREMIIGLAIVLLLFGAKRLPDIARGLDESIRNFKAGIQKDWAPREQRKQSSDSRIYWFIILVCIAAAIILSVLSLDDFTDKQKLVLTIVLLCWIGVGYWSFGRTSRKGDGQ